MQLDDIWYANVPVEGIYITVNGQTEFIRLTGSISKAIALAYGRATGKPARPDYEFSRRITVQSYDEAERRLEVLIADQI